MANCKKLLEKAKNSTANYKFADAIKLAECNGWRFERHQSGSHVHYKNPSALHFVLLTFTDRKGEVPRYQLVNLLSAIEMLEN